jgi:hypothetical protein
MDDDFLRAQFRYSLSDNRSMTIFGLPFKAKQTTPPILREFKRFPDKYILRKEIGCERFYKSFMIGVGA